MRRNRCLSGSTVRAFIVSPCHIHLGLRVIAHDPLPDEDVTDGRERAIGGSLRGAPAPDADLARHRAVIDAFYLAARGGDFDALVAVLQPNVVLRSDFGDARPAASKVVHGATAVAKQALLFTIPGAQMRHVLVNGSAGALVIVAGRPIAVMGFTVANGGIAEIVAVAGPERVTKLASGVLTGE